jgi:hypothetical protein
MSKALSDVKLFDRRPWHLCLLHWRRKTVTGSLEELVHSFFVCCWLVDWIDFHLFGRLCLIEVESDAEIGQRGMLVVNFVLSGIIVVPKFCKTRMSYILSSSFRLAHSSNPLRSARDQPNLSDREVNVMWIKRNLSYYRPMAGILRSFRRNRRPQLTKLSSPTTGNRSISRVTNGEVVFEDSSQ